MTRAYEMEHLVTFEETNLVGNVYYVNHVRWQGACRERFLEEHCPGMLAALRSGLALATTRCSCAYYAELEAFDRVTVRMTLGSVSQNRVLMHFDYLRGEQLVARGEQEIACMRRDGEAMTPVPVPAEMLGALAGYATEGA
jgi:enediyne core biosynthesis thioesterase